jgi:hypothetical protein
MKIGVKIEDRRLGALDCANAFRAEPTRPCIFPSDVRKMRLEVAMVSLYIPRLSSIHKRPSTIPPLTHNS